ncbi:MAG: type II toxin-antitoxin system RelE/ParE family toxin [Thermoplasmata archaeon]|nr:type II toxin-antitoxin system RelE/ParE family toxin [Thermoplasmata archaeon]
MSKQILLSPRAQKDYTVLEKKVRERIKKSLQELATGSKILDIKKLKGVGDREDLFRLRVGDYRITYYPEPDIIKVIRIDHRGKGYNWLN